MSTTQQDREEVGRRGEALYEEKIRAIVETPENIGKFVVIDVDTGAYAVDKLGFDSARDLRARHPGASLYGKRIGYKVSEVLGGVLERAV